MKHLCAYSLLLVSCLGAYAIPAQAGDRHHYGHGHHHGRVVHVHHHHGPLRYGSYTPPVYRHHAVPVYPRYYSYGGGYGYGGYHHGYPVVAGALLGGAVGYYVGRDPYATLLGAAAGAVIAGSAYPH